MKFLTYSLTQLSTAAIKAADVYYEDAIGLKIRELRVLRLIHNMPGSSPTELLDNLELDKTLLSKNLNALEKRGLIQRQTDKRDNRRHCLFLTDAGFKAWQVAETIGKGLEADMFGKLTETEWHQLHDLLNKAQASFQDWQAAHP